MVDKYWAVKAITPFHNRFGRKRRYSRKIELTDSKTPQGIIAEVVMPNLPLADLKAGRYLVLEDVQDPGNVGTMIRTADAAGLDGVLISEKSADIYNQKTLRSMQGSHFHLPIWRTNVYEACQKLQKS